MTIPTPATSENAVRKRHVALTVHDYKKDNMVAFAQTYQIFLSQCDLLATSTTGDRLEKEVGLIVQRVLSGPWGDDLQIGTQSAGGRVDAVIFPRDPMMLQPHEPDINVLARTCDVHNIPHATNLATAGLVTSAL